MTAQASTNAAQRAAWERLWRILLAEPPSERTIAVTNSAADPALTEATDPPTESRR